MRFLSSWIHQIIGKMKCMWSTTKSIVHIQRGNGHESMERNIWRHLTQYLTHIRHQNLFIGSYIFHSWFVHSVDVVHQTQAAPVDTDCKRDMSSERDKKQATKKVTREETWTLQPFNVNNIKVGKNFNGPELNALNRNFSKKRNLIEDCWWI